MLRAPVDLTSHLNQTVVRGHPADFPVTLVPVEIGTPEARRPIPHRLAVVREDTGAPLAVVSDRYTLIPHQRILDAVDAALQSLDVGPVPRGLYVDRGGARMRAVYKLPALAQPIAERDAVCPCLQVLNTYDGATGIALHIGAFASCARTSRSAGAASSPAASWQCTRARFRSMMCPRNSPTTCDASTRSRRCTADGRTLRCRPTRCARSSRTICVAGPRHCAMPGSQRRPRRCTRPTMRRRGLRPTTCGARRRVPTPRRVKPSIPEEVQLNRGNVNKPRHRCLGFFLVIEEPILDGVGSVETNAPVANHAAESRFGLVGGLGSDDLLGHELQRPEVVLEKRRGRRRTWFDGVQKAADSEAWRQRSAEFVPRETFKTLLRRLGSMRNSVSECAGVVQGALLCSKRGRVRPTIAKEPLRTSRNVGRYLPARVAAPIGSEFERRPSVRRENIPVRCPAMARLLPQHVQDERVFEEALPGEKAAEKRQLDD